MTRRPITLTAIVAFAALASCDSPAATDEACLGLPTAPQSARVDLQQPSFTNPTSVTNPLFPISGLQRVLLMGNVGGVPLRVETTLMPGTRTLDLDGEPVDVLTSQYVAWLGRELHEVAIDWYAQADDGAVWYLGEDVHNYEGGVIVDTDGTWLAGRDGPAAMIMPASPQVGDVFRPENVCGIVFEEVAVKTTGVTVNGPRGPVQGAVVMDELHMDGTREDKTFAPGYGEFSSGSATGNLEAVALAVPTDALPGAMPAELATLSAGADSIFDAAQTGGWCAASAIFGRMTTAWNAFQAGSVPPTLRTQMNAAMTALGNAVQTQAIGATRQASVDVDQASLDLQLRHRSVAQIDRELLDLWARQLLVDAAAGDQGAVLADAATLKWIRDRLAPDVTYEPELSRIDGALDGLRAAAAGRNLVAATAVATRLRRTLATRRVTEWRR